MAFSIHFVFIFVATRPAPGDNSGPGVLCGSGAFCSAGFGNDRGFDPSGYGVYYTLALCGYSNISFCYSASQSILLVFVPGSVGFRVGTVQTCEGE